MSCLTVTFVHLSSLVHLHNFVVIWAQACGSKSSVFTEFICTMYHPVSLVSYFVGLCARELVVSSVIPHGPMLTFFGVLRFLLDVPRRRHATTRSTQVAHAQSREFFQASRVGGTRDVVEVVQCRRVVSPCSQVLFGETDRCRMDLSG